MQKVFVTVFFINQNHKFKFSNNYPGVNSHLILIKFALTKTKMHVVFSRYFQIIVCSLVCKYLPFKYKPKSLSKYR